MKKILLFTFLAFAVSGNAQLGGLLKKNKDKNKPTAVNPADPFNGDRYWTEGVYFTKDDGIKTEFHRINIEKIVFGKKPLDPATATAAGVTNAFNTGENIYALVFMKTALRNYKIFNAETNVVKGNLLSQYKFMVSIDGVMQPYMLKSGQLDNHEKGITAFAISCYSTSDGDNSKNFIKSINALSDGMHTIKIELWGGNASMDGDSKTPIAAGEFTLNKKASDILKVCKSFQTVKASKVDKNLEAEMISSLNKSRQAMAEGSIYSAVKITDSDWKIIRTANGAITGRTITTKAMSKLPNGNCQMQQAIFLQEYDGTNYQKAVTVKNLDLYNIEVIDCH